MKKMIVALLLASMVSASLMTACSSGTQQGGGAAAPAEEETADQAGTELTAKEDSAQAQTADQTEEAAQEAETAAAAETAQTGATAEAGTELAQTLPAFRYTGEDPCGEAVCLYLKDNFGQHFDAYDVMIPSVDILEEDLSDPEDTKVWGNFWVYNYSLNGKTLMMENGGQFPGLMHLKKTDTGYEVTSMDLVADGEDNAASVEEIFGAREGLADKYRASCESENQDETRTSWIRMYVEDTGADIDAYQDFGWDPVPLYAAEEDGQNPVMNFIGDYACGRAVMHIECDGTDGAKISVSWSSSAAEHSEWEMTGPFDTDTLTITYDNCVKKDVVFESEDDEDPQETVVYENGKGTITFAEDGSLSLTWQDEEEHMADDLVFEYASYGGTDDETADGSADAQ